MALHSLTRTGALFSVAALVGAAALPAGAASFSKVVAFGDSLTDTGNFLEVTTILSGIAPALFPAPLPQAGDYFNGRFSNGRVAVEVMADALVGGLNDGQALSIENYAYGGAQTGTGGQLPATGLLAQVDQFTSRLQPGFGADASALYFVWAGANDLRGIAANPANAQQIIGSALGNLGQVVTTLYGLGARNFLLPNLPDLSLTPEGRAAGPLAPTFKALSEAFNAQLGLVYGGLSANLPGANLVTFNTMEFQRAITANPAAAGFTNVSDACFSGNVGVPGTKCGTPGTYLYWDRVHPTAAAHEVLGLQMAAAVPEPGTMLMMALGGLALLGAQRRRSQQQG